MNKKTEKPSKATDKKKKFDTDKDFGVKSKNNPEKKHHIDRLERMKKCYMAGFTDSEVMQTLGMGKQAFYDFKNNVPGSRELIRGWKQCRVDNVENALYERALGQKILLTEQKALQVGDKDYKTVEVVSLEKEQYIPPDTQAIKFFLTNRATDNWKDKSELMLSQVQSMSTQELEDAVKALLTKQKEEYVRATNPSANED